jgi:membrane-associated phospholipid phosphatase
VTSPESATRTEHAVGRAVRPSLDRPDVDPDRALFVWLGTVLVGAMVLIGGVAVFAKLADDVADSEGATRADRVVSAWVATHRPDWLTGAVKGLTLVAEPAGLLLLTVLVGAWLTWRRRTWFPLVLAASAPGGCIAIGTTVKLVAQRPRPPMTWWAIPESGYSFPSLHTLAATSALGVLAYLLPRTWPPLRLALGWIAAATGAVLIAASRVYLGVHWPTDVAASFALGSAWLAVLVLAVTIGSVAVPASTPAADG